jgi:hypothetical protein
VIDVLVDHSIVLMELPRLLSAMDRMVEQQVAMMTQSDQLAAQNATLIQQNARMVERIAALEQIVIGRRSSGDWICPVCGNHFSHIGSFKGHVRRLIHPVALKSKCFLDPNNPDHQALVSHARYGQGDFDDRSKIYSLMLYETIRSNSTSTMSSQNSYSAVSSSLHACIFSLTVQIQEWIAAGSAAGPDVADPAQNAQQRHEPWDPDEDE